MSKQEHHLYEFGPYRLLPRERLLLRAGEPVQLTPKAFETLVALVSRAGRLADKEELLKEVWPDSFVEESNLAQNIFALRRALGEGENGKPYIETVPKRGYRFLASVRVVEDRAEELFIGQHVAAQTNAHLIVPLEPESPQPGFASGGAAEGQPIIAVPPRDTTALEESRQALQRPAAPDIRGRSRPKTRNAAIILALLAVALGGGALLYKFVRRANPSSHFQTMKITRLTTTGRVYNAAISPDGKYVAYGLRENTVQSLWVRQVATQSQAQLIAPAEVSYVGLTFSPDGNYIYYNVISKEFPQRALFRAPTIGGPPRKLLEELRGGAISFSPDGGRFAFIRSTRGKESALMIANADGTGARELVAVKNPPEEFDAPAWSPDGKRIAYSVTSYDSFDASVFEAQVADGSTRPLTAQRWLRVIKLAWLADGSGLLMLATPRRNFAYQQIWQLSYPSGEAHRLTNDLNTYASMSLAADAGVLAGVQGQTEASIWVEPVGEPGSARPVTPGAGKTDTCVRWTPDGRIIYTSNASGADDIWIVNADGTDRQQLTSDAGINQCPAASPDGRSIVFLSDRTGAPHLWRMSPDGSDQRQLTDGPRGEQNPQFSPDGRWIVYRTSSGRPTVYKMPAEGGEPVRLTDKMSFAPTVSPDGRWVAYVYEDEDASMHAAIAPLEGGEPVKTFALPGGAPNPRFIQWTPDSRAIAYIHSQNTVSGIIVQPLDGGEPGRLTEVKGARIMSFAFSRDGKQLAFSRATMSSDVVLIKDFR